MKLKYILATEEDRAFFIHVHHTAYRDTIKEMFGWDEKRQDELANRPFDEGGMHVVVHEDKRIGVVGWEEREDHLWLKELFILPDYQNKGIGSQIIQDTITKAKSIAKEVRLRTLKANLRAKELYERHGFNVTEANDIHWNMVLPFTMPEFKTERLLLKPVTNKDISAYKKHFVDYEIIRNLSAAVPWPYPEDGVEYFLNDLLFPHQAESEWLWGLFLHDNPDELIGAIHLWREAKPENRGFWLSREYQGRGLMSEAVKPVMDYAFNDLEFKKLIFANAVGNKKSRRIKEKTKARLLRVEPAKFVDPQFSEHEIWELTAEEWLKDQNEEVVIRLAKSEDALAILEVHYDAVHNIGLADYAPEILKSWSGEVNEDRLQRFLKNTDGEIRLVAEINNKIVGFGAVVLDKCELRACYVSSTAARKGVGKSLINEIEKLAIVEGLQHLSLDSSIIAEPFYLRCGYHVTSRGKHCMGNGMLMDCVFMNKYFKEENL